VPVHDKLCLQINAEYIESVDTDALVTDNNHFAFTLSHNMEITIGNIELV